MTGRDLRDLLADRVSDEVPPDLVAGTWAHGRRRRRARRAGAVAGAVAATLAVVGGVAGVPGLRTGDAGPRPPVATAPAPAPAPGTGTATPTTAVDPDEPGGRTTPLRRLPLRDDVEPDLRVDGAPGVLAPYPQQEEALPLARLDGDPLPPSVVLGDDLARADDALDDPLVVADAAYGVALDGGRSLTDVLLVAGEEVRRVRVADVPALDGAQADPAMLSSDGGFLALRLPDEALAVLDVAAGTWRRVEPDLDGPLADVRMSWFGSDLWLQGPDGSGPTYDPRTGRRVGSSARDLPSPGVDLGDGAVPLGRGRDGTTGTAYAWGATRSLPGRDGEPAVPAPTVVSVPTNGRPALLVVPSEDEGRASPCCSVASWAAGDVLLWESRNDDGTGRLLAWVVGTHAFARVTHVVAPEGVRWVSSYARFWPTAPGDGPVG